MKLDRFSCVFPWLHCGGGEESESPLVPTTVLLDVKNTLDQGADLDTILRRLIVRELTSKGIIVSEGEITPAYISDFRDQHIYPHMDVDFTNRYGGINPPSTCYLTKSEVDRQRAEATQFLSRFA